MLFIHSLTLPLLEGFGAGDGVPSAPPPVTARTRVLIAMPIAVRMLAMVMPCSQKSVRIFLSQHPVFMEEPGDGFTNSAEPGLESCYVHG